MSPCGWIRTTLDSDCAAQNCGIRYQLRALAPQASSFLPLGPISVCSPTFLLLSLWDRWGSASALGKGEDAKTRWGQISSSGTIPFHSPFYLPALASHTFPLLPTLVQDNSPLLASSWIVSIGQRSPLQCSKDHPELPTDKTCTPALGASPTLFLLKNLQRWIWWQTRIGNQPAVQLPPRCSLSWLHDSPSPVRPFLAFFSWG